LFHSHSLGEGLVFFAQALGQEKRAGQQGLADIPVDPPPHPGFDYIDRHLLPLAMMHEAPVPFGKPARPTDRLPIGRPVTGAAKALPIDKTFDQPDRHSVVLGPIALQEPDTFIQNHRRQVSHFHPRQHQKTDVVHHPIQIPRPLGRVPLQQAIPTSQMGDCRLPSQGA